MGILLVYDCTDEQSFNNIRNWMKQIDTHAAKGVAKVLVGNKSDMEDDRAVTKEQGQQLADEFGVPFFETSAKAGVNIQELFFSIASTIVSTLPSKSAGEGSSRQSTRLTGTS